MFTVYGSWQVSVEDTLYTIQADLSVNNYLRVYLNGSVIHESYIPWAEGEIYKFEKGAHTFVLKTEGIFRPSMSFNLFMDGREIGQAAGSQQLSSPLDSTTLNTITEQNVTERVEVIDTETISLDNLSGSAPLVTEKEVSKTVTNELSVQTDLAVGGDFTVGGEVGGELMVKLHAVVEAALSAKLAKQTGQKVGQTITERNRLTFTVQPRSSVTYTVVWKRKIRSGEYVVSVGDGARVVPYSMYYGLLYEVRSGE